MRGFDYFATGPRMGLQVATALDGGGLLESLHLDAWVRPGPSAWLAERLLGTRVRNRVISSIDASTIHAHPELFVLGRIAGRATLAGRDRTTIDRLLVRDFRRISRRCSSPAVFGMQSCCLELFEGRRCKIMEQFAAPSTAERFVVSEEQRRFGGWTHVAVSEPTQWDERNVREWEHADIIWVPSDYVSELCARHGAERSKLRVVRYPIPFYGHPALRSFRADRPLRVIFAGTLMLRKGVQYIYEALHGWDRSAIDMHFVGPNQLTAVGIARLAEVGRVHTAVARAELLDHFARSDVLLFPSLSEGSALVMAEAVGTGLPVIATVESGAPDSAITIPTRDPQAIREALQNILDDPGLVECASRRCLSEAQRRGPKLFNTEIAALARDALRSSRQLDTSLASGSNVT